MSKASALTAWSLRARSGRCGEALHAPPLPVEAAMRAAIDMVQALAGPR
jgi:hypothetical protein